MGYYLISTEHLQDRLWFRDNDDFIAGMNFCAIAAFSTGVIILAFVLMSNHVHFVIRSSKRQAESFITTFKSLYSRYCRRKYGEKEFLRSNGVDIREMPTSDNGVERAIAYVVMNPVSANITTHPSLYLWGSGQCYFSGQKPTGIRLKDMSYRKQIEALHSNTKLPEGYLMLSEGYISPSSYVAVHEVESIFCTSSRMNYFLNHSSKSRKGETVMPSFRDQIMAAAATDLCRSLFRKHAIGDLSQVQTAELLRQMLRRFSADIAQVSRVTGIQYPVAVKLLDSFPEYDPV